MRDAQEVTRAQDAADDARSRIGGALMHLSTLPLGQQGIGSADATLIAASALCLELRALGKLIEYVSQE